MWWQWVKENRKQENWYKNCKVCKISFFPPSEFLTIKNRRTLSDFEKSGMVCGRIRYFLKQMGAILFHYNFWQQSQPRPRQLWAGRLNCFSTLENVLSSLWPPETWENNLWEMVWVVLNCKMQQGSCINCCSCGRRFAIVWRENTSSLQECRAYLNFTSMNCKQTSGL